MSLIGICRRGHPGIRSAGTALVLLFGTGCVGMGGERIALGHDPLSEPNRRFEESIAVERPASDVREDTSRVGRATITVFAITSGSIKTQKPLTEDVVDQVVDALASAGYSATTIEQAGPGRADGPTLIVEIRKFHFKNYNWLWPLVPHWGEIELALILRSEDGRTLYSESFRGSGSSFCPEGECGFSHAANEALTEVLEAIAQACASDEFRRSIAPRFAS